MNEKRGFMFALQILISVVSLLVGLSQITKESAPYIEKVKEHQKQAQVLKQADEQARMNLQYVYRGNDGVYRYYSDPSNVYWSRVNIQGVIEYARNPNIVR
jgi:hypothetical protein